MKKTLVGLLLLFLIWYDAYTYANTMQNEIAGHVIRLHVIANSDSKEDQEIKLKVRDAILSAMRKEAFNSYETAYEAIQRQLPAIQKIAETTLKQNGVNTAATAELVTAYFPSKAYDSLSFPAGNYTAVKVKLGDAKRPQLVVRDVPCSLFYQRYM